MKKLRRRVTYATALSLAGVLCLFTGVSGAEDKKELTDKAYSEYQDGNYQAALDLYNEAGRGQPHSPGLEFNKGLSHYKLGDIEQALKTLESASLSEDPKLAGDAHFNQGNALYGQEDYQRSVEQFKNALRKNPTDAEARHNLELALRKLAEQEKQEQENDEQGEQEDKEDKEKQDQEQDSEDDSEDNQDQQNQDEQQENQDQQNQQENQQKPDSTQSDQKQDPNQDSQQNDPNQMSKEDAERLLNALKNEEMEHQKNKRIKSAKIYRGKDW